MSAHQQLHSIGPYEFIKDWKSQNKMHSSSKIRKGSDNTFLFEQLLSGTSLTIAALVNNCCTY